MANAPSFDWICERLEQSSPLDRLEARGTIRLALKQAGLEARDVTVGQMDVILGKVLPEELKARGIDGEAAICEELQRSLKSANLQEHTSESPDEVFRRLGGS